MNQQNEGTPAGGANPTPPVAATPPAAAASGASPAAASPQPTGELDQFGYEKITPEGTPGAPAKTGNEPKPATPAEPEKIEPVAGYGDKPPKVDPPAAPTPEPEKPLEPVDLGYELKIDEAIPKETARATQEFIKQHFSKEKIDAIAAKHNIPAEAAAEILKLQQEGMQAYVNTIAQNSKAYQDAVKKAEAEAVRQKQETRAKWHEELQTDPTFGGEKFGHNVKLVDRVFNQFMPNWKKALTGKDVVLPPWIMRDIAAIGEQLFATDNLQQGNPVTPPPPKTENNPLDFYN